VNVTVGIGPGWFIISFPLFVNNLGFVSTSVLKVSMNESSKKIILKIKVFILLTIIISPF